MKNTKRLLALLLAVVMTVCSLPLSVFAEDTSVAVYDTVIETELADYLLYQTTYVDNKYVGATAKVSIYADTAADNGTVPTDKRDTIVYVKNWNGARIGTEDDVSIVKSYIEAAASVETGRKTVVIVIDYGYSGGSYAENSVVGVIEHSLGAYRADVISDSKLELDGDNYISVHKNVIHFLPEGYRVERDVLFWESDFHSSLGTMDKVLKAWNEEISNPGDDDYRTVYYDYYVESDFVKVETVDNGDGTTKEVTTEIDNRSEWDKADGATVGSPKHDEDGNVIPYPAGHGAPNVTRVKDCVRADGSPMDYNVRLDIVHPSFAKEEDKVTTPVMMIAATQSPRTTHMISGANNCFGSYSFGGGTAVVYDYAYIPTARQEHYGYNDQYGTHTANAAKWARAAVRCVRYYAETFGYSDELIGVSGLSKGTPTAGILALNHNELAPEKSTYAKSENGTLFEGGANVYQPYSTYEGGYDGNGGLPEENPTVSEVTGTGAIDSNVSVAYVAAGDGIDWHYQDTTIRAHIEKYGTVPLVLSCGAGDSCWARWAPLLEYKQETSNATFLAIPMEDKEHEYPNGIDPIRDYERYDAMNTFIKGYLFPDSYAPSVAYITPKNGSDDVVFDSVIEVQFIANTQIEISQVRNNVTVKSADGKFVTGTWTTHTAETSNLFTFTPDRLEINTEYTVSVSEELKDKNGVALAEAKSVSFTTEGFYSADPVADTYVSVIEPDKSFIDADTLEVDFSASTEKISLATFDKEIISKSNDLSLVLPNIKGNIADVEIALIDGYTVSSETTYNSVKELLESAQPVGKTMIEDGVVRVDVTELIRFVKSDRFTLVIRGMSEDEPHYFEQKFEETLYGFNGGNTEDSVVMEKEGMTRAEFRQLCYSQYYDYSVGYNAAVDDITLTTDSERGSVGYIQKRNGRYRFYDSVTTRLLTADDVGRTLKVSFWAKAVAKNEGTEPYVWYGLMQPNSTTNPKEQLDLTENWKQVSYTMPITSDMLIEGNQKAMFAIVTPDTSGVTYYIDDIIIEELYGSCKFASSEGAVRSAFIMSNVEADRSKPYTDTYISTVFADKNYGDENVVRVNSGENTNIAVASFRSEAIGNSNRLELKLPVIGETNLKVKLSLIEDLLIDETEVTYNNFKDTLDTAVYLGEYTLVDGTVSVDLSKHILSLREQSFFTLVIEAADTKSNQVFKLDFEELDAGDNVSLVNSDTVSTNYYTGNEKYIGIFGYNGFDSNKFTVLEENGNKYITVASRVDSKGSGASRISFFNALAYRALTADDAGKTYNFTIRIRLADGYTSGGAAFWLRDGSGTSKTFINPGSKSLTNEWTTLKISYTFTADEIAQYPKPMLALDLATVDGKGVKFDIDYVSTTVDGVPDSAAIASSENSTKSMAIVGEYISALYPVADAYVSAYRPDKNFGRSEVLAVTSGEDEAIALASFSTDTLLNTDYLAVGIPVINDAYVEADISLIANYCIDESSITYNNIKTELESKVSLGTYVLENGLVNIDLSSKIEELKAYEYFTLVITATEAESHILSLDFEEYTVGTTIGLGQTESITTTYYNGDDYLGLRGYNSFKPSDGKAITINSDEDGNHYASVLTATSNASRWGFLNGTSRRALTDADVGKTLVFTAKVRLSEGYTSGSANCSVRDWKAGKWVNESGTVISSATCPLTLTDNEWHDVTLRYTISKKDLDDTAFKAMFTIEFKASSSGSVGYDVDSVRVYVYNSAILGQGAFISSAETTHIDSKIRLIALNSKEYENKVVADAYTIQGDDNSYGTDDSLILKGEEGANVRVFSTFMASSLEGRNYLKLPTEGICDGQWISVAVADNAIVDEKLLNYYNGQKMVRKAKFVGRYQLDKDNPYIDVSAINENVSSKVFTVIMQADQTHSYLEDFEGTKTLGGSIAENFIYSDKYIYRTGSSGSKSHARKTGVVGADGKTTSTVFYFESGGTRYKLYNSMSYDELTVLDMGRRYTASFDVFTNFAVSNLWVSLKAGNSSGNNIATGPSTAGTDFTMNDYLCRYNYDTNGTDWTHASYEIYLDPYTQIKLPTTQSITTTVGEAAVKYQAAMLTFESAKKNDTSKYYYIDNIKVIEVDGNDEVTTSAFASRESGEETMSFVYFGGTDLELDEKVTVLEAQVSATANDVDEIFFVSGEKSYSLLSLDGKTGNLYFTKDGTRYNLCDSYGNEYFVGREAIPVVAVYDSTNGTVRYVVNGYLAYYKDGDAVVNTYGTELAPKSEAQSVKVGCIGADSTMNAPTITTEKAAYDRSEIIGTQTKYIDYSIRIVSGVDMRYYSQIGFIAEYGAKEPVVTKSNIVYGSINANDVTITAEELNVGYLSTFVIKELEKDDKINGKIFTVTPVVYVGEVEIKGEAVTYRVNLENGEFSVSEVTE